jgi:hypothetical protein
LPVLTKIVAANPNDGTALVRLGFAYTRNGRRTEAVAALTRAVEIEPSRADAHYEIYRALYDDRSPAVSRPALKLAVKCDTDSLVYRFELGVLLDQCADARGAREMFDGLGAGTHAGALESWHDIKSRRMPSTRIFSSTRERLMAGLTLGVRASRQSRRSGRPRACAHNRGEPAGLVRLRSPARRSSCCRRGLPRAPTISPLGTVVGEKLAVPWFPKGKPDVAQ